MEGTIDVNGVSLWHRISGEGWSAIARLLNDTDAATAHGGAKWYPSTVRAVVMSVGLGDGGVTGGILFAALGIIVGGFITYRRRRDGPT